MITTNIIIKRSSLDGPHFKEAIDLGLVCAAFEQSVNLIFVDMGINNLIKGQSALQLKDKNQTDILKNLLEIENASKNFLYLVKNNFDLDEVLKKQKDYWKIIEKYFGYKNKYRTIICPDFYKNNIDLFSDG